MTDGLNFIAIDFETATGKRASVCEVGICAVRNGEIVATRSWLVRPEDNLYSYWNVQCHGITPEDTEDSPSFPEVWEEIERCILTGSISLWLIMRRSTAAVWSIPPGFTTCICRNCNGNVH